MGCSWERKNAVKLWSWASDEEKSAFSKYGVREDCGRTVRKFIEKANRVADETFRVSNVYQRFIKQFRCYGESFY